MELEQFEGKKVLILGFGREGQSSFDLVRKLYPRNRLGIADQIEPNDFQKKSPELAQDKNIDLFLGKNYLNAIGDYDIIIKTPGIPLSAIKSLLKKGAKVTSQTEIFLANCPGKVIGVTGTKGKSTASALTYKVLKEGLLRPAGLRRTDGGKIQLIGNIGKPALDFLPKAKPQDIFVYEMSCHQLAELKQSPHIAVFLNLYPEHLDYYKNFAAYAKAKANITRWQNKNDWLIFNPADEKVAEIAKTNLAKKIKIDPLKAKKIIGKGKTHLKGDFNLLNIAAAVETGKIFKIPEAKILQAIKNFKPLEHRLEKIGPYSGITFYNDALSTIEQSAIAAMDALGPQVETILLGGFDRGLTFKNLAKKILSSNLKTLILFPTTGQKIWDEVKKQSKNGKNLPQSFFADNMADAVKLAYENTRKGKICLMSCASTSFSLFRDYQEKGNLFKKYAEELKPSK
jgi:UDP-N-acetylmuramoylalanine--D-glutamate ligase